MEYFNQWVEYDSVMDTYTYTPWYSGKDIFGGRLVSDTVRMRIGVPSYLGIAWRDSRTHAVVMYPKPLHLVARLIRNCYWLFIKVFYRIGLIDMEQAVAFRWSDFYRIKTHH